jgi:hypothetical protein
MNETLTIRLNGHLAKRLAEEAERSNRSKGQIIREALEERLRKRQPSAFDLMAKFCGIMSGPPDLSTNKKYMADFGKPRKRR